MTGKSVTDKRLSMPDGAGRMIVESAALMACPLLATDRFVTFCKERDLSIDRARLLRFERLGLFAPVFRVRTPDDEDAEPFHIPVRDGKNWFERGWAWDTTPVPARHDIPSDDNESQEGYYSIFQIDGLRLILSQMTLHVQLDSYLVDGSSPGKGRGNSIEKWVEYTRSSLQSSLSHTYRPSIALLCQYISNRYYPKASGDQRTVRTGNVSSWDSWLSVGDHRWDWEEEARKWDPRRTESLFDLTPDKLKHAYETLANGQSFVDPLERWYPLVQFVSIDDRRRLKGPALQAETLREGALMLRWLYLDLYKEELPPPNEVHVTVITHTPELSVRKDVRRYLEFVVNDYGINPQPKLVLFVEGESEERVVNRLFDELFGFPVGRAWIELVVIRGVDNATGGREDNYRAILRLIDYLHHHQTLTFVLLDNENNAERLKIAAAKASSIFGHRKRITRPEYIRVWKRSFEFDNFSDTELASALTEVAEERHAFQSGDVRACRSGANAGAALARLYKNAVDFSLPKLKLADVLVEKMLSAKSRRQIRNRPIVKALHRVAELAIRNPFPTRQEIWEKNQASRILARKR